MFNTIAIVLSLLLSLCVGYVIGRYNLEKRDWKLRRLACKYESIANRMRIISEAGFVPRVELKDTGEWVYIQDKDTGLCFSVTQSKWLPFEEVSGIASNSMAAEVCILALKVPVPK